jgi:hypothetical protein
MAGGEETDLDPATPCGRGVRDGDGREVCDRWVSPVRPHGPRPSSFNNQARRNSRNSRPCVHHHAGQYWPQSFASAPKGPCRRQTGSGKQMLPPSRPIAASSCHRPLSNSSLKQFLCVARRPDSFRPPPDAHSQNARQSSRGGRDSSGVPATASREGLLTRAVHS